MPIKILLPLVLIFIIGLGLLTYWGISQLPAEKPVIQTQKEETFPSERAETFYISGGTIPPVFVKELIIDPAASSILSIVKEGERQTYSIWAKDPGGIEKVIAAISTDTGKELLNFKLVEGTPEEGRWQGSWITKDISLQTIYKTTFEATSNTGSSTSVSLTWDVKKD
jgi:hypothetical protein